MKSYHSLGYSISRIQLFVLLINSTLHYNEDCSNRLPGPLNINKKKNPEKILTSGLILYYNHKSSNHLAYSIYITNNLNDCW